MGLGLPAYEFFNYAECRLVIAVNRIFPRIINRVVIFERISMLVHEEYARHISLSKRIVIAIVSEFTSFQSLKIAILCIDLFKQWKNS